MSKLRFMNFDIALYGKAEPVDDTKSKIRARVFYKYENRNGGYITDQFADQLLSTISYAPIKGIFDFDEEDFTDHGVFRDEGRIYGIVPENPNTAWEKHLDKDGVEREYACVDVYIYTALYKEASLIPEKGLSMELFPDTLNGTWQFLNGKRYFKYTEGCFLGLQALGEKVEPCFEGAAFFTKLSEKFNNLGGKPMKIDFENEAKKQSLLCALNPDYSETNFCTKIIIGYEDDHLVYQDIAESTEGLYRVTYSFNDKEEVVLGDPVACHCFLDVTDKELAALEAIQAINEGTFEEIDTKFTELKDANEKFTAEISEKDAKISEYETQISTLKTENEELETYKKEKEEEEKAAKEKEEEEKAAKEKAAKEKKEKEMAEAAKAKEEEDKSKCQEIEKYSEKLSEESVKEFTANLDNYTLDELKRELAYTVLEANPNLFELAKGFVPNDDNEDSLDEILSRYEK